MSKLKAREVGVVYRSTAFLALQKRFRSKRFKEVERIVRNSLEDREVVSILDVGGTGSYWTLLPQDLRGSVRITCLNYASELDLYRAEPLDLAISYVDGNGCSMPEFEDRSFDLVHSNSVVEHVGSYQNMIDFANEIRRVGKSYYVQTPSFSFPIDPHYARPFIHWLPDPIRIWFFQSFNFGYSKRRDFAGSMKGADATKIISVGIMRGLFPDSFVKKEKFFLLTKSIMAIREK